MDGLLLFACIVDIEWTKGLIGEGAIQVDPDDKQGVLDGLSAVVATIPYENEDVSVVALSSSAIIRYVCSSVGANNSIRIVQCGLGPEFFNKASETIKMEIATLGEWDDALRYADDMAGGSGWVGFVGAFDTQSFLVGELVGSG
ncbi:hypothetical protein [Tahibacter harae]|uniref:Uncharacterized protein n=1 Tax=Tahibacter harae TaxID=2963937 RepID=A0ABT1QZM4_9GAMM|nr:hypothetical protein [Tahibacter harae]MCQ4167739.1 hypothetical protein [Tahibacter harae]